MSRDGMRHAREHAAALQDSINALTARVAELEAEIETLKASCALAAKDAVQFQDERDALRAENEALHMKLAACGVAALCNTTDSRAMHLLPEDSPYWSASYQAVRSAVEREMALRAQLAEAERLLRTAIPLVGPASDYRSWDDWHKARIAWLAAISGDANAT
jgi:chromosome segregation ATPase